MAASVHPHVGGELVIIVSWILGGTGSSPRGWGTLFIIYMIKEERYSRYPLNMLNNLFSKKSQNLLMSTD